MRFILTRLRFFQSRFALLETRFQGSDSLFQGRALLLFTFPSCLKRLPLFRHRRKIERKMRPFEIQRVKTFFKHTHLLFRRLMGRAQFTFATFSVSYICS